MLEAFLFFLAVAALFGWLLRIRLVRRNLAWEPSDPRHNDRDWNPVAFWGMNLPLLGALLFSLGGAFLCVTDMIGLTDFFSGIESENTVAE